MKEYIFGIEEEDSDYEEVFYGWIRKHSHELIRCKDCALWNDADSEHFAGYCTQGDYEKITFRNEWCSWAERKDNETD